MGIHLGIASDGLILLARVQVSQRPEDFCWAWDGNSLFECVVGQQQQHYVSVKRLPPDSFTMPLHRNDVTELEIYSGSDDDDSESDEDIPPELLRIVCPSGRPHVLIVDRGAATAVCSQSSQPNMWNIKVW